MPNPPPLQSANARVSDPRHSRRAVTITVMLLVALLLWQLQQDFAARLQAGEQSSRQYAHRVAEAMQRDLQLRARVSRLQLERFAAQSDAALVDELRATFVSLVALQRLPASAAAPDPQRSAAAGDYHYSFADGRIQLRLHEVGPAQDDWLLYFDLKALERVSQSDDEEHPQWLLEDNPSGRILAPPTVGTPPGSTSISDRDRALSVARMPLAHSDWTLHARFDRAQAGRQLLPEMAGKLAVFLFCALATLFGLLFLQRQVRATRAVNRDIQRALLNGGSILHTIEECVLVTSTSGQIRYANPQAAQLLAGDASANLEGELLQELMPDLAALPTQAQPLDSGAPVLVRVMKSNVPRTFSVARRHLQDPKDPGYAWVLRDVTEEQTALQRLQDARRRYHDIFEGSSIALCVLDLTRLPAFFRAEGIEDEAGLHDWLGRYPLRHAEMLQTIYLCDANQVALRLLETTSLEEAEHRLIQHCPLGRAGVRFNLILSVLLGRRQFESEAQVRMSDGSERHLWMALCLPESTRNYDAVTLSINDITTRKQAQLALAERERFWSQILGAMPDNLYVYDVKQRTLVFGNHHIGKQLGYSDKELQRMGQNFWDYLEHPDDSDYAWRMKGLQQAIPEGKSLEFLARWRHKNGIWHWFNVSEQALTRDAAGRVERLVGIAKDVTEQIHASESLRESERRHRLLAESISDVIYTTDTRLRINYVSSSSMAVLGYSANWLISHDVRTLASNPSQLASVATVLRQIRNASKQPDVLRALDRQISEQVFLFDFLRADDRIVPIEVRLTLMWDEQNHFNGVLGVVRDITQQRSAEKDLRMAATVFEHSTAAIAVTDPAGYLVQVNETFSRVTGYAPAEVLDQLPLLLAADKQQASQLRYVLKLLSQHHSWEGEIWLKRRNGETYPAWVGITAVKDQDGDLVSYVCFFSDISERKASEQRIHRLAYYDPLTQLPNRTLFQDRLHNSLQQAERHGEWLALMFLDLDRFKPINDSLGHAAGDRMLKEVALRLSACVEEEDTVARMGGDEFTLLLRAGESREAALNRAIRVGEQILASLTTPFVLQGREFFVTASIGIALSPQDGKELSQLMKNADTAMYHAKARGKNNFQFYQAEMNARALERLELESDLRHALEQGQFALYYQPQFSCDGQQLTGAEALLRWQHPSRGLISPAEFIPVLEEIGLVVQVGDWVLEEACRQIHAWQAAGMPSTKVSVNLSARQFSEGQLDVRIAQIIEKSGITPACLGLELTESILMQDVTDAMRLLANFKRLGVGVAIDDFGTGYSSLNYLKQFPIDVLKIDRSFVDGLPDGEQDGQIARAIIAMAHSLNLSVIAEGVETEAQLQFLREHGCDQIQGYLLGRPLSAEDFARRFAALD